MTPEEALKRMKDPGEWTLRFTPRSTVAPQRPSVRRSRFQFALTAVAVVAAGAIIAGVAVSMGGSSSVPPVATTPTTEPTTVDANALRGLDSPWNSHTVDWAIRQTVRQWGILKKPERLILGTIEELRPGGTYKYQNSDDGDPFYSWSTAYLGVREQSTGQLVWIELSIDDSQRASDPSAMSSIVFPDDPLVFVTVDGLKDKRNYVEVGEPSPRPAGTVLSMDVQNGLYVGADGHARAYLIGDVPVLGDEEFSSLDDLADAFRNKFNLD